MNSIILTIAIPTYNMEKWLEKNLNTYRDERLSRRIEVLCLNNASEDASKEIIKRFADENPDIFRLIDRSSRGYGSSINDAIQQAKGKYFRIVDADDWVNTEALIGLVDLLEIDDIDVVLTDYRMVNLQTSKEVLVCAAEHRVPYGTVQNNFYWPKVTCPSIHNTTYKTSLLVDHGFYMQDKMFFVDEEYVIIPYLWAKNVIYYPLDLYRYQVADPNQSTSPQNRAKYQDHREKILRRLVQTYEIAEETGASTDSLEYCFERIQRGIGDHFTTLYIYVKDRRKGYELAEAWIGYVRRTPFWSAVRNKQKILKVMNRLNISLRTYLSIKNVVNLFNRIKRKGY